MKERRERSIIVAADVEISELSKLVKNSCLVEGIGGYKIGLVLALEEGLPRTVGVIRDHTELPIIYDHQKAGNDVPVMGTKFARVCRKSGIDAVILFPFGGAKTERDWIHAARDEDLRVIVGAHMTQEQFLVSEGGFVADESPRKIFTIAAEEGVRDFVVPGNKIEFVKNYKELLDGLLGKDNFTLYAPGFVTQKGEVSDFAKVVGNKWHAIVGAAIYNAEDINSAARLMTRQIK